MNEYTLGPPLIYVPIAIRTPLGFLGGPAGYERVEAVGECPLVVETQQNHKHERT